MVSTPSLANFLASAVLMPLTRYAGASIDSLLITLDVGFFVVIFDLVDLGGLEAVCPLSIWLINRKMLAAHFFR